MHMHTTELRTQQHQGQQDAWLNLIRDDITSWRKLQSKHAQSAQQQLTMHDSQQLQLVQDSMLEAPISLQSGPDQQGSAVLWDGSQQQSQQGISTSQAGLSEDTGGFFADVTAVQKLTAQHDALTLGSRSGKESHNQPAAISSAGDWALVPPAAPTPSSTDLPSRHQRGEDFMSEDDYSMAYTGVSYKHQQGYMVGASDTSVAAHSAAYSQNPDGADDTLSGVDAARHDMDADVQEQRPPWAPEVLDTPAPSSARGVLFSSPKATHQGHTCTAVHRLHACTTGSAAVRLTAAA
jgi:hypothetical protein